MASNSSRLREFSQGPRSPALFLPPPALPLPPPALPLPPPALPWPPPTARLPPSAGPPDPRLTLLVPLAAPRRLGPRALRMTASPTATQCLQKKPSCPYGQPHSPRSPAPAGASPRVSTTR